MAGGYQQIHTPTTAPASIMTQNIPESCESTSISPLEDENTSEYRTSTSEAQQNAPKSISATAVPLLDIEKAVPTIRDWPTSPKAVQHSPWLVRSNLLFDILLFACAVAFLAFALVVAHLDKASTANSPRTTKMLLNATKYGPSVFPILFALVLGRATHAILRWRLERGERIGTLDTLAASTSFTSTIISQFQLRTISILGVTLVLLWSLSPIGGQASIRQMTIGTSSTTIPAAFDYLTLGGIIETYENENEKRLFTTIDAIFVGSIATAAFKPSPLDAWGNVRVPRVEYYEEKTGPDNEGWFNSTGEDLTSYVSVIGIPISGTNLTGFIDFKTRIQMSYLEARCSDSTWNSTYLDNRFNEMGFINHTGPGSTIFYTKRESGRPLLDLQNIEPRRFFYKTNLPDDNENYQLDCTLTSSYVEIEIICPQSTSCAATRVRRSRMDSPSPAWTFLDLADRNAEVLFTGLINSPNGYTARTTILDRYLDDPASVVKPGVGRSSSTSRHYSARGYSIRMTQLLNSYYTCLKGVHAIAGGIHNGTVFYWHDQPPSIPTMVPPSPIGMATVWTVEGTKGTSTEIIIAHLPWVLTLCIISTVLILASLVSPLFHFFVIRGPEVMMNISSLATRHNPYIPLPEGGTHMGASVRARLLKTVEIQFGDIEKSSRVGHLVIGSLKDANGQNITRVRGKRLYE